MNLETIVSALTIPTALAFLVALPFWFTRNNQFLGNVLGAAIVFTSSLWFIAREFIFLSELRQHCVEVRGACGDTGVGTAFTHYVILACIGMSEVAALFAVSLVVERRRANRRVDKEWRG